MADIPKVTLNNGIDMPQFGMGVWQANDTEAEMAVSSALTAGYRLIDTAAAYGNEAGVGRAVVASGLPREDVFITTKLWNADQGYDKTLRAFDSSMSKLGLDYLDLYLIHWPVPAKDTYVETWQAFEKLYADKRVRAIGISNFLPDHLNKLMQTATITPVVNQVELHPYLQEQAVRSACAAHDIKIESYSPIGGKAGDVLHDMQINEIAKQYNKTPAQVVLRWHIQNGFIVIPKSVHRERIRENIDIFDFELNDDDIQTLNSLDRGARVGGNPATANFT